MKLVVNNFCMGCGLLYDRRLCHFCFGSCLSARLLKYGVIHGTVSHRNPEKLLCLSFGN